jgi:integrase
MLSDAKIRNAKPRSKPYKLADGEGMFLLVHPNGSKYWRLKYRFFGRERILALGVYPDTGIAEARERRSQARKALAAGNDPADLKQEAKRQGEKKVRNTFEVIAREWLALKSHEWVERYFKISVSRMERHVLPKLGSKPITSINAPDVLSMLRAIESSGAFDTAHRIMQMCGQVFMYAIATGRAERNPVPDLRGALKSPVTKHHASLKEIELPEFLQKLEAYDGALQTKLALRFLILTFVRTTELRAAEWKEFNFDKAEWRVPAERMKMKEEHIVPLSIQAVELLKEVQKQTGNRQHVFPNQHNPVSFMSENTMLFAIYRMGYHSKATSHGFRSTASTILNENGFAPDVIERQLAHGERNKIRAAYNHAQYLPERRKMMQWWADYLDKAAKKSAKSKK